MYDPGDDDEAEDEKEEYEPINTYFGNDFVLDYDFSDEHIEEESDGA